MAGTRLGALEPEPEMDCAAEAAGEQQDMGSNLTQTEGQHHTGLPGALHGRGITY